MATCECRLGRCEGARILNGQVVRGGLETKGNLLRFTEDHVPKYEEICEQPEKLQAAEKSARSHANKLPDKKEPPEVSDKNVADFLDSLK